MAGMHVRNLRRHSKARPKTNTLSCNMPKDGHRQKYRQVRPCCARSYFESIDKFVQQAALAHLTQSELCMHTFCTQLHGFCACSRAYNGDY